MSKKLSVQLPSDELIIMPKSVLSSIKNADKNELKLLIWLYSNAEYNASEAAKALGMSIAEAESAASFWKGAGLLSETERKRKESEISESKPEYGALDIASALDKNESFRNTCEEFSSIIGKVLNRPDHQILLRLFDHCGLSGAFICTAAHYCVSNGKSSMRYIEKTILSILDEGIDTEDALDEYIARKERVKDDVSSLRTLCGMGDRQLTSKEAAFCRIWFEDWRMPFELIRLAYEKTVDATGKISFGYMNKILENWHEDGYSTAEEVASAKKTESGNSSFDADEFFMAALRKSEEDD